MPAVNLPVQPTPFTGRTRELAEILELLLNPACRLLTLVGAGGMGKTRLAVEAGAQLPPEQFSGGVFFVSLQPLSSPQFIPSAVAEAVGVQFYSGMEPLPQLIDCFRRKSLLLILDNFEHLLDGAEFISDLLTSAPQLKVLTTSREMLNLQEEWLYHVRGMHYPLGEPTESLEDYGAVQLFVQSARRARPDFAPDSDTPDIIRICRMVEGMPLALEITAAWLKRLPIQEIAAQLEGGLDILETTARNVPARHRSIRAVFEYSWNLLIDDERDVFKKLSVFRRGFRREAAEAVTRATLGILSALVDKSLLRVDDSGRYDLHGLLRQYAQERLDTAPDEARQVRQNHCAYYLNFTVARAEAILIHASREANAEIKVEFENILSAWDWLIEHRDYLEKFIGHSADDFMWVAAVLRSSFQWRCLFYEGQATFAFAVATLRELPPGRALVVSLATQGLLVFLGSQQYAKAIAIFEEALALARTQNDFAWMADCRLHLSEIMIQMGNYERARQIGLEALENVHQAGNEWIQTFPITNLGHIAYLMGDFREAKRLLEESIALAQEYDVPGGLADAQNYLGQIQIALGYYEDARQTFAENLLCTQRLDYPKGVALALIGLGDAACGLRDFPASRQYYSQALRTAMSSHQVPYVLQALTGVGNLLARTGHRDRALGLFAFVGNHNAAMHETKSSTQRLLADLTAQQPGDKGIEPLNPGSLDEIVQSLLDHELSEQPESPSPTPSPTDILSDRELEILHLMADGLSNREIAERLFLAISTVKWHLTEIYSKMHVSSRTQALVRARELKLIA